MVLETVVEVLSDNRQILQKKNRCVKISNNAFTADRCLISVVCFSFSCSAVPRSICSPPSSNRDAEDKPRKKKAKEKTIWKPNLHSRFVEVMLILGPKKLYVGGNPNRILIDQLFEERRTGKTAAPIPAFLPLPPYNESEASSSRRRNVAKSMPTNYASSSVNAATDTPGLGGLTLQSDINFPGGVNVAMSTFGHGGLANFPCTVVQQQNYHLPNADLQIGSVQHHNDSVIDSSFYANLFEVTSGINEQLGSIQLDPNNGNSFGGGNEFGNASSLPPQLGGGAEMADAGRVINNSTGLDNIPEANYSLLRFPPNLNQE